MLTMVVIDDEYYLRQGVRQIADWSQMGIEIVGDAADGEAGLGLVLRQKPDILLMDIRMPILNGLELMKELRPFQMECAIIVLSGFSDFEYARVAMENGAFAYLLKPVDKEELIGAVCRAAKEIEQKRRQQAYYDKLHAELSSLRQQFIRDVCLGLLADDAVIRERAAFLQMSRDDDPFLSLVIRLDDRELLEEKLGQETANGLLHAVTGRLVEFFLSGQALPGSVFVLTPGEWCVLGHPQSGDDSKAGQLALQAGEALAGQLQSQFRHTFSIGISDLHQDIRHMRKAFLQAAEACRVKVLPERSSVAAYQAVGMAGSRREIADILGYIRNHYQENITVATVSRQLFISPSHLMHMLKNELGLTFNDCVTNCRIEAAKSLLQNSGQKVQDVSRSVGYRDAKYFASVFRKATGFYPKEYARLKARQ